MDDTKQGKKMLLLWLEKGQVGHGGVDSSSSSDALGWWFESHSISKNNTSSPRCHETPSEPGAALTSVILEDRSWVNKKRLGKGLP